MTGLKVSRGRCAAAFAAAVFLFITARCSRYAPIPPPPPKDKILEIELRTAARVADDVYYYIAIDTRDPLTAEGPLEILSGKQRGENWSYYVRLYKGVFTEKLIVAEGDIDEEPDVFNHSSPRYFQAETIWNRITVRIYVTNLVTTPKPIAVNFITSRRPLSPTEEEIEPLDYLIRPRVSMPTSIASYTDSTLNPLSSSHTVAGEADAGADIVEWSMEVYER